MKLPYYHPSFILLQPPCKYVLVIHKILCLSHNLALCNISGVYAGTPPGFGCPCQPKPHLAVTPKVTGTFVPPYLPVASDLELCATLILRAFGDPAYAECLTGA